MAENYMKRYIELSTEFKKDRKSQEIIENKLLINEYLWCIIKNTGG